MCVKDVSYPEGTPVLVHWIRGTQLIETNVKLVTKTKRAYFQQKFSMKTGIEYEDSERKPKLTQIKLFKVVDKSNQLLGECQLDLAQYVEHLDEKSEVISLDKTDGASIEFSIRAMDMKVKKKQPTQWDEHKSVGHTSVGSSGTVIGKVETGDTRDNS